MLSNRTACYCAFCRSERTVYLKKHLSTLDVLLNGLVGLLVMAMIWQDFDPRFIFFSGIGLVVSEFFVHLRWRLAITCSKCGFDPVLYKRNPQKAADNVKAYMSERASDPIRALSSPKLPVIVKKRASLNSVRKEL